MGSSFSEFIKKNLKYIIFALVLWAIGEIFLVAPIALSISQSYSISRKYSIIFINWQGFHK